MVPLHIHTWERPSAASADISHLSEMTFVYMSSVAIFLYNSRTSQPRTPYFFLFSPFNGETQLLVVTGRRVREGLFLRARAYLRNRTGDVGER
ncbi:hypothetical protein M405DRAFT_824333 [Rhizopogon salebrosus TDB-379]|nr:hypothetical protein M405DRAFT_824333 [Rhizopogon salebrosus TDB-379]